MNDSLSGPTTFQDRVNFTIEALSSPEFLVLIYSEMVLLFTATFIIALLIAAFMRSTILHVNSRCPLLNLMWHYYIYASARSIEFVLFFQHQSIGDAVDLYTVPSWYFLYQITDLALCYFVLVGGGTLLVVALERICAIYFIADYEVNERWWISLLLISSLCGAAGLLTVVYYTALFPIWVIAIIVGVSGVMAILVCWKLFLSNITSPSTVRLRSSSTAIARTCPTTKTAH